MRGLTSLTEPGEDDPVGAIVDVAVIGARGDGKTQFIVHAIRTLRAYAPLLAGAEHQYNRDVLQVVMNAHEPRPEATAPGVVPHYVFRIRPHSLLSQVGLAGRVALYGRVAGLWTYLLLALINAAAAGAALAWLRGGPDSASIGAAAGLLALGALLGVALARRRFVRRGDIEIVFWDVAGEHVYSDSAADYYSFLGALVRMRRQRASAQRSYAFAPVLLCNPLSLRTRAEGSSYARLRRLIPLFSTLNEPLARVLVAINRWTVVQRVCAPDSDREELVAVVSQARSAHDETVPDPAPGSEAPPATLPVVKRDVVRKHCLDAEDGWHDDVHFSYLRYDAGIQCEFHEQPWSSWKEQGGAARSRWRAPTAATPDAVLDYSFEDGPGSFEGEVRRTFLNWLAALAFHEASYGPARSRVAGRGAAEPDEEDAGAGPAVDVAFAARRQPAPRTAPAAAEPRLAAPDSETEHDPFATAWQPRPLSASGLEAFARGTIVPDDLVSAAIDQSLAEEEAAATVSAPVGHAGGRRREATQPGIGPVPGQAGTPGSLDGTGGDAGDTTVTAPDAADAVDAVDAVDAADAADAADAVDAVDAADAADAMNAPAALDDETVREAPRERRRERTATEPPPRLGNTLRLPGGFGSGGT